MLSPDLSILPDPAAILTWNVFDTLTNNISEVLVFFCSTAIILTVCQKGLHNIFSH